MVSTEQEEMYRDQFSRTARTTAASHLLLSSAQVIPVTLPAGQDFGYHQSSPDPENDCLASM